MCSLALFHVLYTAPNVLWGETALHINVLCRGEVQSEVLRQFDNNFSGLCHRTALQHFFL